MNPLDWLRYRLTGRPPGLNRGTPGNEGLLTPGITWLLLAADLRCYPDASRCGGHRWTLGGRELPGAIALPDQPDTLVALGWLSTTEFRDMESADDRAQTLITGAGRAALALIERGDHDGYDAYLRAAVDLAHTGRAPVTRDAQTTALPLRIIAAPEPPTDAIPRPEHGETR